MKRFHISRIILASLMTTLLLAACGKKRETIVDPVTTTITPEIDGVRPEVKTPGELVVLNGKGLGVDTSRVAVLVDGIAAQVIKTSDSTIMFVLPFGPGAGRVEVWIDGAPVRTKEGLMLPIAPRKLLAERVAFDLSDFPVLRGYGHTLPPRFAYHVELISEDDSATSDGISRIRMSGNRDGGYRSMEAVLDWKRMVISSLTVFDEDVRFGGGGHMQEQVRDTYERRRFIELVDVPFTVGKGPVITGTLSGAALGAHIRSIRYDSLMTQSFNYGAPTSHYVDSLIALGELRSTSSIRIVLK